ncbi:solute carrier organic anion transporter family member 2A1-like [Agrilus planipennis]|uniref:Solute carrier organic anion transporter family member 2A1-like n=1 Tax=Agrilus planipennis TaxID=224129 RepID=A0A1W4X3K7_AGRPL|nr:solute carrier organic anion transporter family member 2A1-like [Agrilus planipennis]
MVHPRDILRSDSNDGASQFSAPIEKLSGNPVDCGLSVFPCLNRWINLERFAKIGVLLYILIHIGVIQGALFSYFQGTSTIWKRQHGLPDNSLEWFLKLDEILCGVLALTVSYWANRIHRASWIGGLTIFQSIMGLLLIVPEVFYPFHGQVFPKDDNNLCSTTLNATTINETAGAFNEVAIGVLFFYQTFSALGKVALYAITISYIDDSVEMKNSPIFIAVVLASREVGKQVGMNLSWTVVSKESARVFLAPAFLVMSIFLFISGTLIAMFPKSLPSVLLKKAVASILDVANGVEPAEETEADDGFFKTIWRILRNKILIVNVLTSAVIFSAMVNYDLMRPIFYESYFYLPKESFDLSGYNDPWLSQITTNLIKQPFMALSIVLTGFFISKVKPQAKSLALWNGKALGFTIITFGSLAFYNCDKSLQTELGDRITTPFCSSRCICSEEILFSPVCSEIGQTTYFSACHAGCTTVENVNGIKIFGNCTCGSNIHTYVDTKATLGSCNKNCQTFWGVSQANDIIAAGFLASTIITSIMISLRCVNSVDKCVALGFHITFLGIIPYIPFRIVYLVVADLFCQYRASNGVCRLHSQGLGIFLTATTVALLIIAILLSILLCIFVRKLELYKDLKDDKDNNRVNDEELEELESRRDNHSRDYLFRTSSPSTNGNQDSRLKDFSPVSSAIPEDDIREYSNNNNNNNLEINRLITAEPERLDFSLAKGLPLVKTNIEAEVHSNPQGSDDESFKTTTDNITTKNNDSKANSILESDF